MAVNKRAALYPLPCPNALVSHEIVFGPPEPGHAYECRDVFRIGPLTIPLTLVVETPVAVIYRISVNHELLDGATVSNTAVTTHHWWWVPEEDPGETEFAELETILDTFYGGTTMRGYRSARSRLAGYRWVIDNPDGSGPVGPSFRFTSRAVVGTAAFDDIPTQISIAVTEETSVRRRWGRFYLPFLSVNTTTQQGRIQNAVCTNIAAAAASMLTPTLSGWTPVVYGAPEPHLLGVDAVRVDNVFDVIRSRRYDTATFRARNTL